MPPMVDLRAIRKSLGLTQEAFADQLGLDQSTISKMENGHLEVDKRTQLAAQALQMNLGPGGQGSPNASEAA